MNDVQPKRQRTTSDIVIGLAFAFGGLLWLTFIVFFAADAIGDYREAHSPELGTAPPWTWRDTLQHMGGVSGAVTGFAPPAILLGYGVYLICATLRAFMHRIPPHTQ
jgi:hypothetical protein